MDSVHTSLDLNTPDLIHSPVIQPPAHTNPIRLRIPKSYIDSNVEANLIRSGTTLNKKSILATDLVLMGAVHIFIHVVAP